MTPVENRSEQRGMVSGAISQQEDCAAHHTAAFKKSVINRLSRVIGHLERVKRMVEEDKGCNDILIQLLAVKAAVNSTGKIIIKDHMSHCIIHAIEHGDYTEVEEFNKIVDRYI